MVDQFITYTHFNTKITFFNICCDIVYFFVPVNNSSLYVYFVSICVIWRKILERNQLRNWLYNMHINIQISTFSSCIRTNMKICKFCIIVNNQKYLNQSKWRIIDRYGHHTKTKGHTHFSLLGVYKYINKGKTWQKKHSRSRKFDYVFGFV